MTFGRAVLAVVLVLGGSPVFAAPEDRSLPATPLAAEIAERLAGADDIVVAERTLDGDSLRSLYESRNYSPLWLADGALTADARSLVDLFGRAGQEGLEPHDYYVAELAGPLASTSGAETELLMSAAVMRFATDIQAGRFDPGRLGEDVDYERKDVPGPAFALIAAASPEPAAYLTGLAPDSPAYDDLRGILAEYRALADAGGWSAVPDGPTLEPGDIDGTRTIALRRRLAVTGDYASTLVGPPAPAYDPALVEAVRRFQSRHGLETDGVVGPRTRRALNVTVEQRIDQIVASMERWRWLPDDLGDRFIMVNLPGYQLRIVDEGRLVRDMDVIVGLADRQTPLFSSELTWLEFNPTWTMPISIAIKDYLPKLLDDPTYLATHGFRMFAGWQNDAAEIEAAYLDWEAIGEGIKYFRIRQEPGPSNALGKVKFMMANSFSVYLHDTPSRGLFSRSRRAFSSGCVRVQDPIWLAEYLLSDTARWTDSFRAEVMGGWETTRVNLDNPMPVHLAYWTAFRGDDGRINFREDIYGLDAATRTVLTEVRPNSARIALLD